MSDDQRARERELYAELDRLGITHRTVEHEATFTVAESERVKTAMPGGHSKSLLVTDKSNLFLLVALGSVRVDLKGVGERLGAQGRLSFAKPDRLMETMGLVPGSVTPFGLIASGANRIAAVVLDTALLAHDHVWFHPLRNTASTVVSPEGIRTFSRAHARAVYEFSLGTPTDN